MLQGSLQYQLVALGLAQQLAPEKKQENYPRSGKGNADVLEVSLVDAGSPSKFGHKKKQKRGSRSGRRGAVTTVNGVFCVLCGKLVERGKLLNHKQEVHNERMFVESPAQTPRSRNWIVVVSGGLPSLGKRSR